MATAGVGPAIVLENLALPYLADGRLIRPVEAALVIEESHYLVQSEGGRRMSAEAMLCAGWLREEAENLTPTT